MRRQRDAILPFLSGPHVSGRSSNVVDMRLWKIATGGVHAGKETQLMVSEKIDAAVEASAMLEGRQDHGRGHRLLSQASGS